MRAEIAKLGDEEWSCQGCRAGASFVPTARLCAFCLNGFLWRKALRPILHRFSSCLKESDFPGSSTAPLHLQINVKRTAFLGLALASTWLVWSGHFSDPFLLLLGLVAVLATATLAFRMGIMDDEGAPLGLRLRPVSYSAWLAKEVIKSNIQVTRLIIDRRLPIRPRLILVRTIQRTPLGRVILANSITLTPGTVSVDMRGEQIWVHALSVNDAEEDLSGDMNRRVAALGV